MLHDPEGLVRQGYSEGYEAYRNKWIGDHEEMIADLVTAFVPRAKYDRLIASLSPPMPEGVSKLADQHLGRMAARMGAQWVEKRPAPMGEEMVEKAAAAMYERGYPGSRWADANPATRDDIMELARAALSVLTDEGEG